MDRMHAIKTGQYWWAKSIGRLDAWMCMYDTKSLLRSWLMFLNSSLWLSGLWCEALLLELLIVLLEIIDLYLKMIIDMYLTVALLDVSIMMCAHRDCCCGSLTHSEVCTDSGHTVTGVPGVHGAH